MFKRKKTKGKKRPIAVTVIGMAIVVLFIVRLYQVFRPLYEMGLFQSGIVGQPFYTSTELTDAGRALLDSVFYFILAIGLVIVLIGFLRMRRWSWVMLMTWVGISMVSSLVDYFYFDQPNYVIMASDVVIAFALSQADVARIFGVRTDIGENLL
jgi:hypothetical protein